MSWQATSWAARQRAGSSVRKVILLLIANEATKAGVCWSGQKHIATEAECARETVSRNLTELIDAGLIARFPRRRANGSKTSDWLVLAPAAEDRGEMADADPDEAPDEVVRAARRSCEPASREPASCDADGGVHVTLTGGPETVREQKERDSPVVSGRARAVERTISLPIGGRQRPPEHDTPWDTEHGHVIDDVVSILQGAIDGLTNEERNPAPDRAVIRQALREHDPGCELAIRVATHTRSIAQSQDKAPNISGLYARQLAQAAHQAA